MRWRRSVQAGYDPTFMLDKFVGDTLQTFDSSALRARLAKLATSGLLDAQEHAELDGHAEARVRGQSLGRLLPSSTRLTLCPPSPPRRRPPRRPHTMTQ